MKLAGKGRYATETYPEANRAVAAFQNRAIAAVYPASDLPGFTPSGGLLGAAIVVPKASGIFMLLANIRLACNGSPGDVFLNAHFSTGTNLSLSGGDFSSQGWLFGTLNPPVVTGVATPQISAVSLSQVTLGAGELGTLTASGLNDIPLPLGQTAVMNLVLAGGTALNSVGVQASLIELP